MGLLAIKSTHIPGMNISTDGCFYLSIVLPALEKLGIKSRYNFSLRDGKLLELQIIIQEELIRIVKNWYEKQKPKNSYHMEYELEIFGYQLRLGRNYGEGTSIDKLYNIYNQIEETLRREENLFFTYTWNFNINLKLSEIGAVGEIEFDREKYPAKLLEQMLEKLGIKVEIMDEFTLIGNQASELLVLLEKKLKPIIKIRAKKQPHKIDDPINVLGELLSLKDVNEIPTIRDLYKLYEQASCVVKYGIPGAQLLFDMAESHILIKSTLSPFTEISTISFLEDSIKHPHLVEIFSQMCIKREERFVFQDDRLDKFLNLLRAYLLNFMKERFTSISTIKNVNDDEVIWGFILKPDIGHSEIIAKTLHNIFELGSTAHLCSGQLHFYYN